MALRLVEVTGRWLGYGPDAAKGSVVFTPEGFREVPADDTTRAPVPVPLELINGAISTQLVAPTDPDEPDVRYQVAVRLVGRPTVVSDDFEILMPVVPDGDDPIRLDLADRDRQTGLMAVGDPVVDPPPDGGGGDGGGGSDDPCGDCLSD